jgi:hypothetical protein
VLLAVEFDDILSAVFLLGNFGWAEKSGSSVGIADSYAGAIGG